MKLSVSKEKLLEGLQTVQNVVSTRTTLPSFPTSCSQAEDGAASAHHHRPRCRHARQRRSRRREARRHHPARPPSLHHRPRTSRQRRSISKSIPKTSPPSAAAPAFSKSSACPRRNFRRCRNSKSAKTFTLRQKDLKDGLKKTAYAISTDETRYVLNGILFSFKDNKLTLVATDGRRLGAGRYRTRISAQPRSRHHRSHQGRHRTCPPCLRGWRRED